MTPFPLIPMLPEAQEQHGVANTPRFDRAQEAVEKLGIAAFIGQQQTVILQRIEQNFSRNRAENQATLLFIADSLPLAAAIVQVGSTVKNFRRAHDWVREELSTADAPSVLSVLTLLYIIHKGCEAALQSGSQPSQELWNEMSQKVDDALGAV